MEAFMTLVLATDLEILKVLYGPSKTSVGH